MKNGCSPLSCDVTEIVDVDETLRSERPELIIHCAAKSDVDYCQMENKQSFNVNTIGAMNVFSVAEKYNIPVVFLSSDHVFSGRWWGSYQENSEDFEPVNYYGLTKFGAEAAAHSYDNVKIVRTSVHFDKMRPSIKSYLDLVRREEKVYPPLFMWRSFMYLGHLVDSLVEYSQKFNEMPKTLHLSGSKNVSWYRFIKSYASYLGYNSDLVIPRIHKIHTPGMAPRPERCGLSTLLSEKLGFQQYDYLDGIRECEEE